MPDDTGAPTAKRSLRSRTVRVVAACVAATAVLVALGFLAAPPLLKPIVEKKLSAALARPVTVGRLRINPLMLSATLNDVRVGPRGEGPDLLAVDELYANVQAMSLFRRAPVISEIRLTRPSVHLVRESATRYNVSDLVDQARAAPPGPPPRFAVSNISVVDGRVDFDDRPERQKHEVTKIDIGIPFISSLPVDAEIRVEPRLSALVNGRPIAVTGETRPFKDTHETVLHWETSGLPLPRYLDYVPGGLPVRVTAGTLDAKVDLSYVARGRDPPQLTLSGNARVDDVVVQERAGIPLGAVHSASVVLDRLDVIDAIAQVRSVRVEGAELEVRRDAAGNLNLAAIASSPASPSTPPAHEGKPFRFHVAQIALKDAKVRYADQAVAPAFATALGDISLEMNDLGSEAGRAATFALSFTTDAGERFSHKGTLALRPLALDGHLEVTALKLGHVFPYYGSALNLVVDDGTLDLATDLRFADASQAIALTGLRATARDLTLRLPDEKQPLWHVSTLAVGGGAVDVAKQTIGFDTVEAHGASVQVRRDKDGGLNFDRLLKASAAGAKPAAAGNAWQIGIRKTTLDGLSATYVDEAVQPPAKVTLSNVVAIGDDLSTSGSSRSRINVRGTVNRRGSLSIAGPLSASRGTAALNVAAKDVDLVPFQGYLTQQARIVLTGGRASLRGTVEYARDATPMLRFKGDATLADVATLDEESHSDLLKWRSLALGRVEAATAPLAVSIEEIAADQLYARLILSEQGELNLQTLARDRPSGETTSGATQDAHAAAPAEEVKSRLRLGKASLTASNLDFTDHFIRPNYSANVTGVSGTLSTLAFDHPADLELHGNVQGSAPVEIKGRINPLARSLYLDLAAEAREVELPPLTPYSAKYVGYGIEKGKLSMKVHYRVEDRKLAADNAVILDQLTFGPRVESAEATKLPVQLAVSLLKDRNGVINFELPIGGSLDDPQFSVGGLVWRALGNLIVKMVSAPFALLGKLAGHGEALAYVEFAPGSAALDASANDKIDSLAKALGDRPALKLDIAGRVDPGADREALKRAAVDRKVRAVKFDQLARSRAPPASVDAVTIVPEEYDALLASVFRAANLPKPRDSSGATREPTRTDMETALQASVTVSDDDLRRLADQRAIAVRDQLTGGAHVPSERMFVTASKLDGGVKDQGKPTRVDFTLR